MNCSAISCQKVSVKNQTQNLQRFQTHCNSRHSSTRIPFIKHSSTYCFIKSRTFSHCLSPNPSYYHRSPTYIRMSAATTGSAVPALIAFDLDATLWYPEMYQLYGGAPFKKHENGKDLKDRHGERIYLMGSSREILKELATQDKWSDTIVAYVSRCDEPAWASSCLKLFTIHEEQSISMHSLADFHEIYPGTKTTHFKRIQQQTKIEYSEMLFFDNEKWNCKDVQPLGVVCQHTPNGLTKDAWEEGLRKYQAAAAGGGGSKKRGLAVGVGRESG